MVILSLFFYNIKIIKVTLYIMNCQMHCGMAALLLPAMVAFPGAVASLEAAPRESLNSSQPSSKEVIAINPINLNYRFQPGPDPERREAADPVIEWYKDAYYLVASKSGGYWYSEDLKDWTYVPTSTIPSIEQYAPAILPLDDALYFLSGGNARIYKNANPKQDSWTEIESKIPFPVDDPALYRDDDGRVYLYWGCSDKKPIMGVEVDVEDGFRPISEPIVLIEHNGDKYGWEVPGVNNEEPRQGWNEGAGMIKENGKYYLQYAGPGTQYRIYADGVYVGDTPLGPFTYMENNPFSFKPGGFIGGAGHGHTFRDRFGNLWHVASMTIAQRHMFERRLGLFPVAMNGEGDMYALTEKSDYPFVIPQKRVDFSRYDTSKGWNLLSRGKAVSSSSALPGYAPENANDEKVETWWAASSGDAGGWLSIDLGRKMKIMAIQPNFADQGFSVRPPHAPITYKYHIEVSKDNKEWTLVTDRSSNSTIDAPHELLLMDSPVEARYVRIVSDGVPEGNFSLYDFRIFGEAKGAKPGKVTDFKVERDAADPRAFRFSWSPAKDASGYILRWGVDPERLIHSAVVYDTDYEARYFNRDSKYYFSLTPFNECGKGKTLSK